MSTTGATVSAATDESVSLNLKKGAARIMRAIAIAAALAALVLWTVGTVALVKLI